MQIHLFSKRDKVKYFVESILKVLEKVKQIDNNRVPMKIYLDLSKAFDTHIDPCLSLFKIEDMYTMKTFK